TWAYDNYANIPDGQAWPAAGVEPARAAREALVSPGRARLDIASGDHPRAVLDLFLREGEGGGLGVLRHGGFWTALEGRHRSHLAHGSLAHGYAVAVPSYPLAPEVRISEITRSVGQAITHAAGLVRGPIRLVGHSAGGHLVTRMISHTTPLAPNVSGRIAGTV